MENLLQVGVITAPHGIRGEVKVFPTTDDVQRFKKLKKVILDTGKGQLTLEIEGVKFLKKFTILKFKGIDSIDEAERYRSKALLVTREDAVPLGKNEYFVADLIGVQVFTEDGQEFGVLKDVMKTGANDVYIIQTKEHGEVLLPAIKECVRKVDIEKRRMDIYLMPGLI